MIFNVHFSVLWASQGFNELLVAGTASDCSSSFAVICIYGYMYVPITICSVLRHTAFLSTVRAVRDLYGWLVNEHQLRQRIHVVSVGLYFT